MARTPFHRSARVASLCRQVISELVRHEVADPRVDGVTVTDVEITGDLREARVFFSVNGGQDAVDEALEGLSRASGFIRRELGKRVRLRVTPSVTFRYDASLEYGARIEKRLHDLGLGQDTTDPEAHVDGDPSDGEA